MDNLKRIIAILLTLTVFCGVPSVDATELRRIDIKSIEGTVSTSNSTTTPLAADTGGVDHIFTGPSEDVKNVGMILVSTFSDVASAADGLSVQFSPDATNWDSADVFTIPAATSKTFSFQPVYRYFRIVYTNGVVAQTAFRLQTQFKLTYVKPSSHRIQDSITTEDDSELVKSVLSGEDQEGTFRNIKSTEVGNLMTADFLVEVARGNIPGYTSVHKFGAGVLTTSAAPVTLSGTYQTPIANTALEFISDNVNDTSAGTGAQEITIVGLVESGGVWSEVIQTIETNGTTAVQLGTDLIRLYRWFVSRAGTYASPSAASHAGNLTIRVSGAGATWTTIPNSPLPFAQSQIGSYTVPEGKTAFIFNKSIFVDTTKTADIFFFQRPFANDVTTPFSGTRRLVEREIGIQGGYNVDFPIPKGPFVGPCDLGFLGVVSSGTADISVEFIILLIDD